MSRVPVLSMLLLALTALAMTAGSQPAIAQEDLLPDVITLPEVLAEIASNRRWLGRYGVLVGLVRNPLTPDGLARRLLPRLAVKDLRALSMDRGASQAIRTLTRRSSRR